MLRTINNISACLCARRNFCRAQFNISFLFHRRFYSITCLMTPKACTAEVEHAIQAWSIFGAVGNEFIFRSFYLIISVSFLFDCFSLPTCEGKCILYSFHVFSLLLMDSWRAALRRMFAAFTKTNCLLNRIWLFLIQNKLAQIILLNEIKKVTLKKNYKMCWNFGLMYMAFFASVNGCIRHSRLFLIAESWLIIIRRMRSSCMYIHAYILKFSQYYYYFTLRT